MNYIRILTVIALISAPHIAHGADFSKGLSAHDAGDYKVAYRELLPLAEQGHARA
jgi:hypothetical protein